MTATGVTHAPGYVVVEDGKIRELGAGQGPEVAGARSIDGSGMWLTPGLIDTHSHLGVYPSPDLAAHGDGNEATAPTTPGVWAEHSLWPQDPGFQRAIEGGITALQVLPGSANLVGGRGVVVEVVPARGSRAMRFPGAPETVKMACGENPKRVYGEKGGPGTRMGNLRGQREAFLGAEAYLHKWQEYGRKEVSWQERTAAGRKKEPAGERPTPPDRDLDQETLAGILVGRFLPQVHCYRADDMLSFLQVADEFGFEVRSFHHALEAYKIRDVLAERSVAVSTWADWWGFKIEAYDGIPENLGLVHEAGGLAVTHSDSAIGIQRLNQETGKALAAARAAGIEITDDEALRWITANPAWTLGIDAMTGTIAPGKRADLVLWDHQPLSVYASARSVWVAGILRWDAENPEIWSDYLIGQEVGP
ncbi:MAG: amidohydrolase family protein [Deltaproteobacteria bacterium]|nr:amidohydrolase family protein [Deltaproteobacteria bacterium]